MPGVFSSNAHLHLPFVFMQSQTARPIWCTPLYSWVTMAPAVSADTKSCVCVLILINTHAHTYTHWVCFPDADSRPASYPRSAAHTVPPLQIYSYNCLNPIHVVWNRCDLSVTTDATPTSWLPRHLPNSSLNSTSFSLSKSSQKRVGGISVGLVFTFGCKGKPWMGFLFFFSFLFLLFNLHVWIWYGFIRAGVLLCPLK